MVIQKRKAKPRRRSSADVEWERQRNEEADLLSARFRDEDGNHDPARFKAHLNGILLRWKAAVRNEPLPTKRSTPRKPLSPARHVKSGAKHIYVVGVSCVGKPAIGGQLAKNLGIPFIDFDTEMERRTGKSISRLKAPFMPAHSFRADVAAPILKAVIEENASKRAVIELPPSGLMDAYWRVVKKDDDAVVVAVCDRSANIIKRVTFYDDDSKRVTVKLNKKQLKRYLIEIQKDVEVEHFGRTYKRADVRVDLAGADIEESAKMIAAAIATHLPAHMTNSARSRNAEKR